MEVLAAIFSEQSLPQLIPVPVIVPEPVPEGETETVYVDETVPCVVTEMLPDWPETFPTAS